MAKSVQLAQPAKPVLPSILELGKMLAVADNARVRYSEKDDICARDSEMLAYARVDALRDLIVTMPAKTLADAAVQLSIANLLASGNQRQQ